MTKKKPLKENKNGISQKSMRAKKNKDSQNTKGKGSQGTKVTKKAKNKETHRGGHHHGK